MDKVRVAVVTPTRGDRPEFLAWCRRQVERQTYGDVKHIVVDYPPRENDYEPDILERMVQGYTLAREIADVMVVMEDDDYYPADYVERMVGYWQMHGRPALFGIASTLYYHLPTLRHRMLVHDGRASLMQTMVGLDAELQWPRKNTPFVDVELWRGSAGVAEHYSMHTAGIKHGVGMAGGSAHRESFWDKRAGDPDVDLSFFARDPEARKFYRETRDKLLAR